MVVFLGRKGYPWTLSQQVKTERVKIYAKYLKKFNFEFISIV